MRSELPWVQVACYFYAEGVVAIGFRSASEPPGLGAQSSILTHEFVGSVGGLDHRHFPRGQRTQQIREIVRLQGSVDCVDQLIDRHFRFYDVGPGNQRAAQLERRKKARLRTPDLL